MPEASRRASCPRPSASPRSCRGGGRCLQGAGRRSAEWQETAAAFPGDGEGLGEQGVEGFTFGHPLPEELCPGPEIVVREALEIRLQRADLLDDRLHPLHLALI